MKWAPIDIHVWYMAFDQNPTTVTDQEAAAPATETSEAENKKAAGWNGCACSKSLHKEVAMSIGTSKKVSCLGSSKQGVSMSGLLSPRVLHRKIAMKMVMNTSTPRKPVAHPHSKAAG